MNPIHAKDHLYIEIYPSGLFTKEVDSRLAKRPLKTDGRLANLGITSLAKEAMLRLNVLLSFLLLLFFYVYHNNQQS